MTLHPALVFLGGLVVVVLGAEMVLRGAARIAGLLRVSRAEGGLFVGAYLLYFGGLLALRA